MPESQPNFREPELKRLDEGVKPQRSRIADSLKRLQRDASDSLSSPDALAPPTPAKPTTAGNVAPADVGDVNESKNERLKKIEKILEEDLSEYYNSLPDKERQLFKAAGEQAARQIDKVFEIGKANSYKVAESIRTWLRVVPGVSKWFIEQDSKIKADKIVRACSALQPAST